MFGENAAAISSVALDKGTLELEPTYSYSVVGSEWIEGDLTDLDVLEKGSSLSWRMTYGFGQGLEAGLGAPTDFSSIGLSIKKTILQKEVFAFGAAAGVTIPTTMPLQDAAKEPTAYGLALLGYWTFEQSSIDLNFQIQEMSNSTLDSPTGYFFNVDWGRWAIPGKLRYMAGMGLQHFDNQQSISSLWSIYPAIQYDFWEHFSLVLNSQHDFAGRNAQKSNVWSVTFTTIW